LYTRAVGYSYEAVKIFMPANRGKPVYAKYIEHAPPDVTAGIFWLKNCDPQHWRDSQQLEHLLGKYIISDKPMTEEEWARERADVLDAEPQFGDGREENHKAHADKLLVKKWAETTAVAANVDPRGASARRITRGLHANIEGVCVLR
jgi:hypothetical protein